MQGKLIIKSKVLQPKKTKSSASKRRTKPERSSTPQRWSRRIRSLPPIPINVLKLRRKNKKCANSNRETLTSTTSLGGVKSRNLCHKANRQRKETVFIDDIRPVDKSDSVEVVKIVPVVVYVKNSTKPQNIVPDEIRMHINDNPIWQMVPPQVINTHIPKKVKRRFRLGERHSQRIRTIANHRRGQNMGQVTKRKYSSRKKIPLVH